MTETPKISTRTFSPVRTHVSWHFLLFTFTFNQIENIITHLALLLFYYVFILNPLCIPYPNPLCIPYPKMCQGRDDPFPDIPSFPNIFPFSHKFSSQFYRHYSIFSYIVSFYPQTSFHEISHRLFFTESLLLLGVDISNSTQSRLTMITSITFLLVSQNFSIVQAVFRVVIIDFHKIFLTVNGINQPDEKN